MADDRRQNERCPICGCFVAHGENQTPYGSEPYVWCSLCVVFPPLARSDQSTPRGQSEA